MTTKWAIYGPQTNQLSGRFFTHNLGNSPMLSKSVLRRWGSASRCRFCSVWPRTSSTATVWTLPQLWATTTVVSDWPTSPHSPCLGTPVRRTGYSGRSTRSSVRHMSATGRPTSAGDPLLKRSVNRGVNPSLSGVKRYQNKAFNHFAPSPLCHACGLPWS